MLCRLDNRVIRLGLDGKIGQCILIFTTFKYAAQCRLGILGFEQGTGILAVHPIPEQFQIGAQKHRNAKFRNKRTIIAKHECPATR